MTLAPKHEAFAKAYLETGNASEAYRIASPHSKKWKPQAVHVRASQLLASDKVQLRLSELQQASAQKHEITIEKLTEMTLNAYKESQRIAPTTGQMQTASMIKAAEFLGKLHGLVVEKSEMTGKDGVPLIPSVNVSITRPGAQK